MVGESCFEGVLCKTDVSLRWFFVICFNRCLVDYGQLAGSLQLHDFGRSCVECRIDLLCALIFCLRLGIQL